MSSPTHMIPPFSQLTTLHGPNNPPKRPTPKANATLSDFAHREAIFPTALPRSQTKPLRNILPSITEIPEQDPARQEVDLKAAQFREQVKHRHDKMPNISDVLEKIVPSPAYLAYLEELHLEEQFRFEEQVVLDYELRQREAKAIPCPSCSCSCGLRRRFSLLLPRGLRKRKNAPGCFAPLRG